MQTGDRAHLHVGQKSGLVAQPAVAASWAALRAAGRGWLTVTLGAPPAGEARGAGGGGWGELAAGLGDADIVFGVCAFELGGQPRFFFFSWVGPAASPIKRGRVPLLRGGVYALFEGVCADVSLVEREELPAAAVAARLAKALPDASRAVTLAE